MRPSFGIVHLALGKDEHAVAAVNGFAAKRKLSRKPDNRGSGKTLKSKVASQKPS